MTPRIDIFTLVPQAFGWFVEQHPLADALAAGIVELRVHNIRDHTPLSHHTVDDTPYGGGPGMVIRVDVVAAALEAVFGEPAAAVRERRRVVLLTPGGRPFDDRMAVELAADLTQPTEAAEPAAGRVSGEPAPAQSAQPHEGRAAGDRPARAAGEGLRDLVLVCGRYEGFDARVAELLAGEELSIGPFVLAGGEVAAMAVVEAVVRKLPGVLGNDESVVEESFSAQLGGGVEYPQYTRPREYLGVEVPEVLVSGNHAAIARWRREHARPSRWGR